MRRFVLPGPVEGRDSLLLTGRDHHYLTRVLRLSPGDSFTGVDASGRAWKCTVDSVSSDTLCVAVQPGEEVLNPAPSTSEPRITLFQCLPKGSKFDLIVRQATECGVSEIVPVRSRFAVADLPEERVERRLDRLRRIAREAVQQSGGVLPSILPPEPIERLSELWHDRGPALLFHQDCLDYSGFLGTLSRTPVAVAICIGPEGGFAPEEVEALSSVGFIPTRLGPLVLRTETAALYAIAAVQVAVRQIAQIAQTVIPE